MASRRANLGWAALLVAAVVLVVVQAASRATSARTGTR
jgi:hypothetical protein